MPTREHRIKKYATDARVNGEKKTGYMYSCPPCNIVAQAYPTKAARDRAAEKHLER